MAAKLTRLTHKIAIQLNLVTKSCNHLQFSLQATSPETFGFTLVRVVTFRVIMICFVRVIHLFKK